MALISTWYVGGLPVTAGQASVAPVAQLASVAPQAVSIKPQTIRRAPDGFFYVKARINGTPVRLLVDTAASMLVLNQSDAARVGVVARYSQGHGTLIGIGGGTSYQMAHVKRIALGDRTIHNVQAAVTNGGAQVSLVGQNVLAQLSALEIRGDELRFQ